MALTFTKKLIMNVGNKKLSMYDVTHDGTETSIDASDIGLHYIDHAIAGQNDTGTDVATYTNGLTTNYGAALGMTALSANAITSIWAFGW